MTAQKRSDGSSRRMTKRQTIPAPRRTVPWPFFCETTPRRRIASASNGWLRTPTNEALASYLPQVAVKVDSIADGLDGIPEGLRDKESVLVGQAVFLRGRNLVPQWWDYARYALEKYPDSEHLRMLVAFADVDEISREDTAQRTFMVDADQRARLAAAATMLEADWRAKPWLLTNGFDDAVHTLSVAMIAYRFLHDREKALAHAERLVDEGIKDPGVLLNGVMVALSFGMIDLARRLIALAPDDPDLAFHAGVIAVGDNRWLDAVALFARSNVPAREERVTEAAIELAPIAESGRPADASSADPAPLAALISRFSDSARGLVLIAQVATALGLDAVAESAFKAAVEAVPEDCHIATRPHVAHAAERAGSPATVIQLLDGHLAGSTDSTLISSCFRSPTPTSTLIANGTSRFFSRLPARLRDLHRIARAHASVLLDVGRLPEAIKLLRRLHAEDPTDAFVTMRLVDALRYSGDTADAAAVLRALDLSRSVGIPEHIIRLAHEVLREGDFEKAYVAAYELVRRHANNPNIALGYAGLGLMNEVNPMFTRRPRGLARLLPSWRPMGCAKTS